MICAMRTTISLNDRLDPVEHRWRWFWWGIALQAIGVAIPVVVAVQRARHDGVGGSITRATIRLVWHQMAQHPGDIGVIVLGMVVFVAGSMVLTRPLVSRRSHLVLAVPAAALLGFVVFGVIALLDRRCYCVGGLRLRGLVHAEPGESQRSR